MVVALKTSIKDQTIFINHLSSNYCITPFGLFAMSEIAVVLIQKENFASQQTIDKVKHNEHKVSLGAPTTQKLTQPNNGRTSAQAQKKRTQTKGYRNTRISFL